MDITSAIMEPELGCSAFTVERLTYTRTAEGTTSRSVTHQAMEMMKMKISAIEFSLAGDKYLGRSYEEMDEIRWTGRMRNSWKAEHKNTRTQKTLRMEFASVGMKRGTVGMRRVGMRWEIII